MEGFNISRIEKIPGCTLISASGIRGTAQTAYRLFSLFSKSDIKIVFVLQSTNIEDDSADLGIVIKSDDTEKAKMLCDEIFFDGRTVIREIKIYAAVDSECIDEAREALLHGLDEI